MSVMKDMIYKILAGRKEGEIELESDSLFYELSQKNNDRWGGRQSRFLLLLCALVISIIFIFGSFIFFIHDVILFQNKMAINECGAFVPTRSCDREYVLFMFNSSDVWANTGIQLQEGDRIRISVSGAFNSSIANLEHDTYFNCKSQYNWYGNSLLNKRGSEKEEIGNCMYNGKKARFGSILFQIQPDAEFCRYDTIGNKIHQLDVEDREMMDIKENGILYFAVNDIYLTDSVIQKYITRNQKIFNKDSISSQEFLHYQDSVKLFYKVQDSLFVIGDGLLDHFRSPRYREVWYNDNIGAILINIVIERKVTYGFLKPSNWYRHVEEDIFAALEKSTMLGKVWSILYKSLYWTIILLGLGLVYFILGIGILIIFWLPFKFLLMTGQKVCKIRL